MRKSKNWISQPKLNLLEKPNPMLKLFDILDQYNVQYLVFDHEDDLNLIKIFQHNPKWKSDFDDQTTVLYSRVKTT